MVAKPWYMDGQGRKRYLSSLLFSSEVAKPYFSFFGNKFCGRFLTKVFHFSANMQCAVKGTKKAKASTSITRIEPNPRKADVREKTIAAIRRIARNVGQMMPDRTEVHLPYTGVDHFYNRLKKMLQPMSEERSTFVKLQRVPTSILYSRSSRRTLRPLGYTGSRNAAHVTA